MKNSKTWWNEIKNNNDLFNDWLKDQYHGEITAAHRIKELAEKVAAPKVQRVLSIIAAQEADHAKWIKELLISRGLSPQILTKEERYWSKTLPKNYLDMPIEKLAAIGAHAEAMRLERIKVISADKDAPTDVRSVFNSILMDELFHEKAFRKIAGESNMAASLEAHKEGLAALGLTV